MDPEAGQAISAQLNPDETLLWADRPDTARTLFYPVLVCLFLSGRLYFSPLPGPTRFHLAIVLSVLVLLTSWLLNRRAFYGLTDRRAITVASVFARTWTRSANLVNRLEQPIAIRRGFLGKVTFGRSRNGGNSADDPNVGLVFYAVANGEGVCEKALTAQQRMLAEIDARMKARGATAVRPSP
jgi:hypothetical protein